jgi:hypothetical protein
MCATWMTASKASNATHSNTTKAKALGLALRSLRIHV